MKSFYFPLVLTIGGNVLYHISQKSVPQTANPLLTMMLAYAVGILVCALCAVFYPAGQSFSVAIGEVNWAVVTIGIGATAVELGYLLAYRVGWNISLAPVVSSVGVTVLLIPIGLLAFREHLSGWNVVGVVFCLVGLFLVTRK
jgi:uncharacterized membrane protein